MPRLVDLPGARFELFTEGAGPILIGSTHQYLARRDVLASARAAPFVHALAAAGRVVMVNRRSVGDSSRASPARGYGRRPLPADHSWAFHRATSASRQASEQ